MFGCQFHLDLDLPELFELLKHRLALEPSSPLIDSAQDVVADNLNLLTTSSLVGIFGNLLESPPVVRSHALTRRVFSESSLSSQIG